MLSGDEKIMLAPITANPTGTTAMIRAHDLHIHISVCEGKVECQARQWMMPKIVATKHSVKKAGSSISLSMS
jgi:hypothetical protein